MKIFMTLNEFNDYIPACIICGKDMFMKISGAVSKPSHIGESNILYRTKSSINLKSTIKDGIIHFKHHGGDKIYKLSVNPDTNQVVEGLDLLNNMVTSFIYVKKNCQTCDFNITTIHTETMKKLKIFPPLKLFSEKLHYTMKRGKAVSIMRDYFDDSALLGSRTLVSIAGKPVKEVNLDLSRFKNLEQLNNRLSTIIVFQ